MPTENRGPDRADEPVRPTAPPPWTQRLRRAESLVPALAAGLVAITAVAAAVMATRPDPPDAADSPVTQAEAPTAPAAPAAPTSEPQEVVKAPPLKPTPAVGPVVAPQEAMGTAAGCPNCGVVQMVVAVHGYAQAQPSGYQMHIRMDDGSVRTVEQRGALAAGSRVIVERDSVRLMAERSHQS